MAERAKTIQAFAESETAWTAQLKQASLELARLASDGVATPTGDQGSRRNRGTLLPYTSPGSCPGEPAAPYQGAGPSRLIAECKTRSQTGQATGYRWTPILAGMAPAKQSTRRCTRRPLLGPWSRLRLGRRGDVLCYENFVSPLLALVLGLWTHFQAVVAGVLPLGIELCLCDPRQPDFQYTAWAPTSPQGPNITYPRWFSGDKDSHSACEIHKPFLEVMHSPRNETCCGPPVAPVVPSSGAWGRMDNCRALG